MNTPTKVFRRELQEYIRQMEQAGRGDIARAAVKRLEGENPELFRPPATGAFSAGAHSILIVDGHGFIC